MIRITDLTSDAATYAVGGTVGAAFGGLTWLVRRVLLLNKQMALMEQEAVLREVHRQEYVDELHYLRDKLDEVHAAMLRGSYGGSHNEGDG